MKPETRETVLMILKADGTVTQPLMDAIVFAMEGGVIDPIVPREEAREIFHVGNRALEKMANKGLIDRVMGSGSRALGYSRPSVARLALGLSIKKGQRAR